MMKEPSNHVAKKHSDIKKRTNEDKKVICEQWKVSGKSKSQFCRELGIPLPTFCAWCDKVWLPTKKKNQHFSPLHLVNKPVIKLEEKNDLTLIEISLPSQSVISFKLSIQNLVTFVREMCHAIATVR